MPISTSFFNIKGHRDDEQTNHIHSSGKKGGMTDTDNVRCIFAALRKWRNHLSSAVGIIDAGFKVIR